jgi:hypothetical protein
LPTSAGSAVSHFTNSKGKKGIAEEIPLALFTSELPNHFCLSLGFDAFRNRAHIEAVRHEHHGFDQLHQGWCKKVKLKLNFTCDNVRHWGRMIKGSVYI